MEQEIWKPIVGYEGLYEVSNLGRVKSLNYLGKHITQILKLTANKAGYKAVLLCKNGKPRRHLLHRLVAEAFIPNPENKPCIDHIDTDASNNKVSNLRWVTHKENNNNPLTVVHMKKAAKARPSRSNLSEETREKIRVSKLGERNPNYGKRASEETLKKMREVHTGKKHSEETRRKMSLSQTGHPCSEETRRKLSRIVDEYDRDGNFVKTWKSIREAAKHLHCSASNISLCLGGRVKTASGRIWRYHDTQSTTS